MKILLKSADITEIYSANFLLSENGIPTFIGFSHTEKYTLWVCLEFQYDDAISVLKDPDHEVKEPVDQIDFQNFIDFSMKNINKVILKEMMWPSIITLSVFVLVLIYSNTA